MVYKINKDWKRLAKEIAKDLGDQRALLDQYLIEMLDQSTGEDAIEDGGDCSYQLLHMCEQAIGELFGPDVNETVPPVETDAFYPAVLRFIRENPLPDCSPNLRKLFYFDSLFADYCQMCAAAYALLWTSEHMEASETLQQISAVIGRPRAWQFDLCVRSTFLAEDRKRILDEGMKLVYRDQLLSYDPQTEQRVFRLIYDQVNIEES